MKRRYRTDRVRRLKARWRRQELAAKKLCINNGAHGSATEGVLCKSCREQHRRSA